MSHRDGDVPYVRLCARTRDQRAETTHMPSSGIPDKQEKGTEAMKALPGRAEPRHACGVAGAQRRASYPKQAKVKFLEATSNGTSLENVQGDPG